MNIYIDPNTDTPKEKEVKTSRIIEGFEIGFENADPESHAEFKFLKYENGFIPLIYWDDKVEQYFTSRITINNLAVSDLKRIEVTAGFDQTTQNGETITVSNLTGRIKLNDGYISGRGSGRTLVEIKIEGEWLVDSPEADQAIEKCKQELFEHINTLDLEPNYKKIEEKEIELAKRLKEVPKKLNRSEYENWCEHFNIEPNDSDCIYAYKYHNREFSSYDLKTQLEQELIIRHGAYNASQLKPIEVKIESTVPVQNGQLWEPCSCGREPVYLPLGVCDKCWPKE